MAASPSKPSSPWDTSGASSFASDIRFMPLGKTGRSFGQIGTASVERRTKATGVNPGTLKHLAKDPASGRHTGAYSRKKAGK